MISNWISCSFPYRLALSIFHIPFSIFTGFAKSNRYRQLYPDISRTILFDFDLRFILLSSPRGLYAKGV